MLLKNVLTAGKKVGLNSMVAIEKAAGLGNGVIRQWDEKSPRMDSLLKVANALDTSVAALMEGVQIEEAKPKRKAI